MATVGVSPIGARVGAHRRVMTRQRGPEDPGGAAARLLPWYQRLMIVSGTVVRFVSVGVLWGLGLQLVVDGVSGTGPAGTRYLWFIAISGAVFVLAFGLRRFAVHRLHVLRRQGVAVRRVLAIGPGASISDMMDRFAADTEHPFVVVGACVEGDNGLVEDVPQVDRIPLAGGPDAAWDVDQLVRRVVAALDGVGADTVCVVPGSQFTGANLRGLAWALSERGIDLVTELGMVDVAPHRLWVRRAGAATVVHVNPAPLRGLRRRVKSAADRLLAALILLVLSPVLAAVVVAVKVTSAGPVVYRQKRVGQGGRMFTMLKFRSMYADADERRAGLLESVSVEGPMFKMYDDPRITRVGRVLRKYSLDELPQLVNVLRGEMSLVGPRPPLPEEVATYNAMESRRLLVTPGLTGLWQVSGRSNLTWDETIRLDLRYVDNWTIAGDLRLLGRTAGAVARGTGAY